MVRLNTKLSSSSLEMTLCCMPRRLMIGAAGSKSSLLTDETDKETENPEMLPKPSNTNILKPIFHTVPSYQPPTSLLHTAGGGFWNQDDSRSPNPCRSMSALGN